MNKLNSNKAVLILPDGIAVEAEDNDDALLADRISERFRSEVDWIERIVSHAPTVGEHYEHLLLSLLAERIGSDFGVGRGFVLDSGTRDVSTQLDLVLYRTAASKPIYQRSDFVIVDNATVLGVGEVKKTLTKRDVQSICRKSFAQSLGTRNGWPHGCQRLHVFAVRSKVAIDVVLRVVQEQFGAFAVASKEKAASFGVPGLIQNLCLPSFYFFDRDELVETSLRHSDGFSFQMSFVVAKARRDSLASMIADLLSHGDNHNELLCASVRNFRAKGESDARVQIARRYTAVELAARFPKDIERLKTLDTGAHILGALVAANVELERYNSLQDFTSTSPFAWVCLKPDSEPKLDR